MRSNQKAVGFLEKILDAGPYIIIGVSFLIGILSIVSLLGVDVYTGQLVGKHLTTDNLFGLLISFAETGLIVATVGVLLHGWKSDWSIWVVAPLVVVVLGLVLVDAYFDGMSVDISRFGTIVVVGDVLLPPEAVAHNLFRILVAGISLIGEPLATSSVMFFPSMKIWLRNLFGNSDTLHSQNSGMSHRVQPSESRKPNSLYPSSIPRAGTAYPSPDFRPIHNYGEQD